MRRLLTLIIALLFLEVLFFGILSPLLPQLKDELSISTTQIGFLVAAYAIGGLVGAIPGGLLSLHVGVRATAVGSLLLLTLASVAFGVSDSYAGLVSARVCQGLAAAGYWTAAMVWLLETAPPATRGRTLGLVFGISEAGAVAGPAIGGLAASVGRAPTFAAIAAVAIVLAAATSRFPPPPRLAIPGLHLARTLSDRHVRVAMMAALLPAVVLAAVMVLGPLEQHRLGAGSTEIAITFGVAAAVGVVVRPLFGRWSDRVGPLRPVRLGLLATAPVVAATAWVSSSLAVAVLIVATLVFTGVMWAPLMVMLSDACAVAGAGMLSAVVAIDLIWPPGNTLGAAGAGAITQAAGEKVAYAAIAAALLVAYLALARTHVSIPAPASAPSR